MKASFLSAAVIILILALSCSWTSRNDEPTVSDGDGFAVVELFTSEGCSSCPPADAVVARVLKEHHDNVFVLGYHVDYWDNYGWKDVFSSADYTRRQKIYARTLKLPTVYTPQVVVNGTQQFVGSNEKRLNSAIDAELKQPASVKLELAASIQAEGTILISYKTNATGDLNVALIQSEAENKIERGENHGATLHHVNIVREIKIIPLQAAEGKITLHLPAGLSAKDCSVIAFTQNSNDLKITSATQLRID